MPEPSAATDYPAAYATDVVLRDGLTVHVRPVRGEDRAAIRDFLDGLSSSSIAFRFFAAGTNLDWVADWAVDVDYRDRFGIVAETGAPSRVVAHAAYIRVDRDRAEVAFLVADDWQGRGLSTIMLAHLAEAAAERSIHTFVADVLPSNHRMIDVFGQSGLAVDVRAEPDIIKVQCPTAISPEAAQRFRERDRIAAVAAVSSVLNPRSVAVIGASRRRGTVGGELLHNLSTAGFEGALHVVNRRGGEVQGYPSVRSLQELTQPVELAIVVVPAAAVLDVARQCAAAHVRAMIVISAGFAEHDSDGAERQRQLLAICRSAGLRLVGPNCLGALNAASHLNATFAPRRPPAGRIALLSQSGGLGIAIIEAAERMGVGLSSFVSIGNRADLSGNDFLQFWEQDRDTGLVLLYLESFGNPRKFARIARRIARRKPVIAVKSGRTPAGVRGAASHTGALLAASDATVEALFAQAGVIRTDTLAQMFDVTRLLDRQPAPAGDRIAIVTNAGGPGIMCADACQAAGAQVPPITGRLAAQLSAGLAPEASVANPVDMIATATADQYRRTICTLARSGCFDALLVIFVPPLVTSAEDVALAIRAAVDDCNECPVAAVFMTVDEPPGLRGDSPVPVFQFPEQAAYALARAARYGRWRREPEEVVPAPDPIAMARGAAAISHELAAEPGWITAEAVCELLDCYGIAHAAQRLVAADDAEALDAAVTALGGRVVLKAVAPGLVHKTEAGGVAVGLDSVEAVRRAAARIRGAVTDAGHPVEAFVVQEMIDGLAQLLIGVVHDESFGPVLVCGTGGTAAELIGDIAVRITPVGRRAARAMLRSLRSFPLLTGYRGSPACDTTSLEAVIVAVSAMVEAHPEIIELDLNPLIAGRDGAVVVDARIRVQQPPTPTPTPAVGR